MREFFELWDQALNVRPHMVLEVGYTRVTDYCVIIHDSTGVGIREAKKIISEQGCDRDLTIAKAYIKLSEYLSETCGGY